MEGSAKMAKVYFTNSEVLVALRAYHCLCATDDITYESTKFVPTIPSGGAPVLKDLFDKTLKDALADVAGRIPVIKDFRQATGMGLKDSKDVIDEAYDKKSLWTIDMLKARMDAAGAVYK
jgi:ribosomal protein L7/L12